MTYNLVCERRGAEVKVTCPADLMPHPKRFATKRQEHFLTITLDGNHQIIRAHIVSIGLLNRTLIHPREVPGGWPKASSFAKRKTEAKRSPEGTDPSGEKGGCTRPRKRPRG